VHLLVWGCLCVTIGHIPASKILPVEQLFPGRPLQISVFGVKVALSQLCSWLSTV
jgi:hypothetical protein